MNLPGTVPPQWSLALGEIGRGLVWLGVTFFLATALGWYLSSKYPRYRKPASLGFTLGSLCLLGTFLVLALLFANNRFEFTYVSGHGDSKNTLPYRIAGVWAGQQGSFLLWGCCSAVIGLFAMRGTGVYRRWFSITYSLFLGTICGILAYETPFGLNLMNGQPMVPPDGVGLSPALQNYWVTIHPPTIFLGFGALTVPFALAVAALLTGNTKDWVSVVRPWSILSLTLVGLGLCMGGFWAYETLGWGGFWMWDPVENTSFVPWVLMTAFTHGILVQATKGKWVIANLLLGGLPFISFMYGTFLTRSGMLADTSVHSFAQMDNVALKILLGFMGLACIGFFILWGVRAVAWRKVASETVDESRGFHREAFYRLSVWFLVALGIATAIGMSVPMFMSLGGQKPKVVEEALYHRVLTWMFVPLVIVMAFGPLVSWRGMSAKDLAKRAYGIVCATLFVLGLTMVIFARSPLIAGRTEPINLPFGLHVPVIPWVLFLVGICALAVISNVWRVCELFKRSSLSTGAFLAHIGVSVLMTGLVISRGLEVKDEFVVQEGGHNAGLGYMVAYKGMTKTVEDRDNRVRFLLQNRSEKFEVTPGYYMVNMADGQQNPMVWPSIRRHLLYDIYFTLHPRQSDASEAVTLAPGETQRAGGFDLTFQKMVRKGEPGQMGTRFGAQILVGMNGQMATLTPEMEITGEGVVRHDAALGKDFRVSLQSMDAGSHTATVQVHLNKAVYPVEMFFKPMTILVFLGTAIMTIAGVMSARYRWPKTALPSEAAVFTEPVKDSVKEPAMAHGKWNP